MSRNAINAKSITAIGPYSLGVETGGFIFLSGQTPVDPKTGKIVEGGIGEQTRQSFANLFQILSEAGLTPDDVQKVNVYLVGMENFNAMNEVYKQQFTMPYPSRTTIGVASLPMGAMVEIEIIAKR